MYSIVYQSVACTSCYGVGETEIQFSYGENWAHRYRIGDPIIWAPRCIGIPGKRLVVVHALGTCMRCGQPDWDFDVYIADNIIVAVQFDLGHFSVYSGRLFGPS